MDERLPLSARTVVVITTAVIFWGCSAENQNENGGLQPGISSSTGAGAGSAAGDGAAGGAAAGAGRGTAGSAAAGDVVVPGEDCAAVSQTADNTLQPADIIWAIDTSGSMSEEIVFVQNYMNEFSQQIVDSGIDAHVVLIARALDAGTDSQAQPQDFWDNLFGGGGGGGGNWETRGVCINAPLGSGFCPDDTNLPNYAHIDQEVGSHDALTQFAATFPQWQQHLRPNATRTFVVVTDDNAEFENDSDYNSGAAQQLTNATEFTAWVSQHPDVFPAWSFSGIFCFTECPDAAATGTVYSELVAQTSGVSGDLCLQDFQPVFDALAQSVIANAKLDCQWEIPPPPAGDIFNVDQTNVQYTDAGAVQSLIGHVPDEASCGQRGGWYYDDPVNPGKVLVCPETCAEIQSQPQAQIDILFGCDTVELLE